MADDVDYANDMMSTRLDNELQRRALIERATVGTEDCIDCGITIPKARREARPNARRCVPCQCESEM